MTHCPCCTHPMIRHIRHQQVYWFCRSCWQEMPVWATAGVKVTTVLRPTGFHSGVQFPHLRPTY